MAAAGAEAPEVRLESGAPHCPCPPGKLPKRKPGRNARAGRRATRRDIAFRATDTAAPRRAPQAPPCPRPLTLLAARPARCPQSLPAPGPCEARPAPSAAVPRTRRPSPRRRPASETPPLPTAVWGHPGGDGGSLRLEVRGHEGATPL